MSKISRPFLDCDPSYHESRCRNDKYECIVEELLASFLICNCTRPMQAKKDAGDTEQAHRSVEENSHQSSDDSDRTQNEVLFNETQEPLPAAFASFACFFHANRTESPVKNESNGSHNRNNTRGNDWIIEERKHGACQHHIVAETATCAVY